MFLVFLVQLSDKISIDNTKQNLYLQYFISLLGILHYIYTHMGKKTTFPEQKFTAASVFQPSPRTTTTTAATVTSTEARLSFADQWQCPQRSQVTTETPLTPKRQLQHQAVSQV
jgi:hypothetical protein